MTPAVLITRPEPAALIFADQVRTRLGCGVPIVVSPLLRIEHCTDLPKLDDINALVFTSQNGVLAFASLTSRRDIPCYTVGDATAAAAEQQGMTAISASGNANDLLRLLREKNPKGKILHLHGQHVTADIAGQLRAVGTDTEQAVIYRQAAQELSAEAHMLLDHSTPVIVPLFSPRSARLLFRQGPFTAPMLAASISANTENAIPEGMVFRAEIAQQPDSKAVLDAVMHLFDAARGLAGGYSAT